MLAQLTFFKILKNTKSSRTVWLAVVLITGITSVVARHPGEQSARSRTANRSCSGQPTRTPSWEKGKKPNGPKRSPSWEKGKSKAAATILCS